ncbi:DUF3881 family protein [Butyrivibrio sp. MC2013]|uniref:DUF3881 family protein n=1 Tax=Butyrivibrio sp. MC2013 TaxID=1280686 RepID=UPI000427A093|nr:DUF3881 family protein [Butyrivibrio sp. MC2013]
MHKYLKAIGLSGLEGRGALEKLLGYCVKFADKKEYIKAEDGEMRAQFSKELAPGMGVSVCGRMKEGNSFVYEYYYPYIKGLGVSSTEEIKAERHSATDSYAGICDDSRLAISMIFYLLNPIEYRKLSAEGKKAVKSVILSALANKGTIILPLAKTPVQTRQLKKKHERRTRLISSAKNGDERAIETLSMEDMETYNTVSSRVREVDLYTLVDNYFMPTGVECDQYSIMGEITDYSLLVNSYTKEPVYLLSLICNSIEFELAIAKKNLYGEPDIGRRFKGDIWLQGYVSKAEQ